MSDVTDYPHIHQFHGGLQDIANARHEIIAVGRLLDAVGMTKLADRLADVVHEIEGGVALIKEGHNGADRFHRGMSDEFTGTVFKAVLAGVFKSPEDISS